MMRINKMIGKLKRLLFQLCFKVGNYETKANLLRKKCYHIGKNTRICNNDFGTEPYLISIEDDVIVAMGVHFINHDASIYNVFRHLGIELTTPEKMGPIILRKNCFVGAYSILLPGTDVGENSIIAAGSVVSKKIPANEVWGGTCSIHNDYRAVF